MDFHFKPLTKKGIKDSMAKATKKQNNTKEQAPDTPASTKDIAIYDGGQFAVATQEISEITEIINETLGGESLKPSDLERVKVPSGGGLFWSIPTFDGVVPNEVLDGIIIHSEVNRAYWETEYTGTGTPPDCISVNLRIGSGNPGGNCKVCPFNEFGSGKNGRSKACQEKRVTFILTQDSMLPLCLYIPAASLDNAKNYLLMKLAARRIRPFQVVTRFGLVAARNDDGQDFSKVTLSSLGQVQDLEKIKAYVDAMKPALEQAARETVSETADDPAQNSPTSTDNSTSETEDPLKTGSD